MMKGFIKKLIVCSAVAVLVAVCGFTALADGTVTYDGNARDFIFAPGSDYSPTDLFTDFKGLMPGESVTQKVTVDNKLEKNVKIKVYMRSLGAESGSEDFLSKLSLTVKQDGDSEMFAAPASDTAQLTDWVYLGTVYSGGKIDLDVTLDVPTSLSNDYQNAVGYLDWEFKVDELPVEKDDPKLPKTGESSKVTVAVAVLGAAVIAVAALAVLKKKSNKSENGNTEA